jgi:hypothetical protein
VHKALSKGSLEEIVRKVPGVKGIDNQTDAGLSTS